MVVYLYVFSMPVRHFDRVNHRTRFKKLSEGVFQDIYYVYYWYKNQTICIRWGDVDSVKLKVPMWTMSINI